MSIFRCSAILTNSKVQKSRAGIEDEHSSLPLPIEKGICQLCRMYQKQSAECLENVIFLVLRRQLEVTSNKQQLVSSLDSCVSTLLVLCYSFQCITTYLPDFLAGFARLGAASVILVSHLSIYIIKYCQNGIPSVPKITMYICMCLLQPVIHKKKQCVKLNFKSGKTILLKH